MFNTYILLGSNLGDSKKYIADAILEIEKNIGTIQSKSSLYQTAAWGNNDQPDFINQVLHVKTKLQPEELLNAVLSIEKVLGRERLEKWGSRTIDIDILLIDDLVLNTANLFVPHPFMHLRKFTLLPLNEIASEIIHPQLLKSISELLIELDDDLSVNKLEL